MKNLLLLLPLFLPITAFGGELSAGSREEAAHLFAYLETSGCEFYRNGTWHKGDVAGAHLRQKYQYLLGSGLLSSTESFIEKAATKSSFGGKLYQVRCGASGAVSSSSWLDAELARHRKRTANRSLTHVAPDGARR